MSQRFKDKIYTSRNDFKKFLCVFASLWLLNSHTFSQDDSTRFFKPVDVFAQADSISVIVILNSCTPYFVLNEKKLNDLAVTDVGAALKFVPGVQLKDYGGIGGIKTVTFRSLGATHTGVNVDGIRIPNVQSGSINLTSFEIFGVNEVGFTSGQTEENNVSASAYLNANSISVKSYLAKRPKKFSAGLYSTTSTISAYEQGLFIQTPLGKNVFLGVQGMTRFGNGDYKFIYEPSGNGAEQRRSNSALFNYKLKSIVGLNFKNSLTLFTANYYNNEQELPGAMILYNPSNDQKLWNEDNRFSVVHDQKIGNWKLQLNGFYQSTWLRYFDPDFLNLQGFIDDNYLQKNYAGGFMLKRPILKSKVLLFAGSDLISSILNGSSLLISPERIENNSVLGFKAWFGKFKLESNLTMQLVSDKLDENGIVTTNNFEEFSPFVAMAWLPLKSEVFRVRGFYKRAFTLPTFNDLYYNFIGNTNLNPERANMFSLGANYVKRRNRWMGEFSADVFYNQILDKIIAIPTKDLFNWSMQNIGEIDARGFDLSALITYTKKNWKFTMNGSFSYNLSLDVTDTESSTYQSQIPYTPFHSASGGFNADYKGYRLNLNVIYTGFRYSLNENIYANYLKSFTDISANFSKEFIIKNKIGVTTIVAAQNILGVNYEVVRSFPMPGRYYQFTLKLNLK